MASLHCDNQDELMRRAADSLEKYLDLFSMYIIPNGRTEEEVKKAVKTVRKGIKRLRHGGSKGLSCLNVERTNELLDAGRLDYLGGD